MSEPKRSRLEVYGDLRAQGHSHVDARARTSWLAWDAEEIAHEVSAALPKIDPQRPCTCEHVFAEHSPRVPHPCRVPDCSGCSGFAIDACELAVGEAFRLEYDDTPLLRIDDGPESMVHYVTLRGSRGMIKRSARVLPDPVVTAVLAREAGPR